MACPGLTRPDFADCQAFAKAASRAARSSSVRSSPSSSSTSSRTVPSGKLVGSSRQSRPSFTLTRIPDTLQVYAPEPRHAIRLRRCTQHFHRNTFRGRVREPNGRGSGDKCPLRSRAPTRGLILVLLVGGLGGVRGKIAMRQPRLQVRKEQPAFAPIDGGYRGIFATGGRIDGGYGRKQFEPPDQGYFAAKARPDSDLRYRSNSRARASSSKQLDTRSFPGRHWAVCGERPRRPAPDGSERRANDGRRC